MGDIKALKDVVEKNISENNYIDIEAIDEYVRSLGIDYNLIKPLIEKIYLSNLSLTNKEKNLKNKIDDYYKNIKINPLIEKDSQTTYNKKLTNIMEVKFYQSRVLYIQLSQDVYMILTCFIKKSDNAKDYANYLKHISDIFEMQKNDILKNIQDDSFMEDEANFHELLKSFIGGEDYGKIKKIFR